MTVEPAGGDMDEPLDGLLARSLEFLRADRAAVLLAADDGAKLMVETAIGYDETTLGTVVRLTDGPAGAALAEGRTVSSGSAVCTPLTTGATLGVLHVEKDGGFAPGELSLVELVAGWLAQAVDRARLLFLERDARQRAEDAHRRLTFVADATSVLSASLDASNRLSTLASLLVPTVADYCTVDVVEGNGAIRRVAFEHADPGDAELASQLVREFPHDPASPYGVPWVIRTGRSQWSYDIPDELVALASHDDAHAELIRRLAPRSVVIVPLVARGHTLGALTLAMTGRSGRRYDADDLAMAEELGRGAALAVDNARLFTDAQEARDRYSGLLETIEAVVWEAPAGGDRLTFVSERARELLGYPIRRWLEEPHFRFSVVHPADRAALVEAHVTAVREGRDHDLEYRARTADGRVLWLRDVVRVELGRDGRAELLRGLTIDVTGRRVAQQRMEAQLGVTRVLAEVETVTDAAPRILEVVCRSLDWDVGALWLVTPWLERLRCVELWHVPTMPVPNFAAASRSRVYGPGEGLPGLCWEKRQTVWMPDVVISDNFPRAPAAAAEGLHASFGFPLMAHGEVLGVVEFLSRDVRPEEPELLQTMATIGGLVGQFVQRRRVQDAVAASEARKTAILEAAIDCVISIDHQGRITEWNPAAEHTFGWRREEVVGRELAELIIPPALRDAHNLGLARYLAKGEGPIIGKRIESTGMRRDGTEFPLELAITRVDVPGPPAFTGYLRDITDQRRAQQALLESRERVAAVARTLQQSLLPPHLPEIPGVEAAARYRPAGTGNEVGGDFYDVFEVGRGEWGVVIGDVCGKGPEAAAVTALARYTVRAAAMSIRTPRLILHQLNEALMRQQPDQRFTTVAYARLEPTDRGGQHLVVACGGHPLPLVLRHDGHVESVGIPGSLLGIFPEVEIADDATDLRAGDAVVFFTDGVLEARDANGDQLGGARLEALLESCTGLDAGAIAERLEDGVADFQKGDARDDVALLVLRVK